MAYQTGTATDIGDLISKLSTFAQGLATTPWTEDEYSAAGQATLHLDDLYVTFRWDPTTYTNWLVLYQSLGWTTSTDPWDMPDDSGQGTTASVSQSFHRHVQFTDGDGGDNSGPFVAYHFFAGEGDEPYLYVVVESVTGVFRHFGCGNLKKLNDFTGGEFVYCHSWNENASYIDNPSTAQHSVFLDHASSANLAASMHLEDFPGQDVDGKWAVAVGPNTAPGTDRAGEPREHIMGHARNGGWAGNLLWIPATDLGAYRVMVPITVVHVVTSTTPDQWRWLGELPGVALINMKNYSAGDEITVGSDTYQIFPLVRKKYEDNATEETRNAGIAYLKVT